ncbi:unnamed protein product [Ilex paraguariensis]|uniref:WAC domain-containing protein n=1 Tax=Ilex paraguariensis TaxID=185542 RepID=A0ABC8SXX3_9AQUA
MLTLVYFASGMEMRESKSHKICQCVFSGGGAYLVGSPCSCRSTWVCGVARVGVSRCVVYGGGEAKRKDHRLSSLFPLRTQFLGSFLKIPVGFFAAPRMPLYKRKTFPLSERPKDLNPQELVFQVRFTKEIFRDYGEYLNRINLYRQRVWTCKVTGKGNLTYEEALVCERRATEMVQQFPKELVAPVLHDVQFSKYSLL